MANQASYTCATDGSYGDIYIKGRSSSPQWIARLFSSGSYTGCQRAQIAVNRLNSMFSNPGRYWFEFCTPGMVSYPTYSVIIVPNVNRRSTPDASWYSTTKELIMDVGPNDAVAPWYTALLWANNIRREVADDYGYNPTPLYAPSGSGITDTDFVYRNQADSYYGAGESLNKQTITGEVFHICDLTVATRVRWTQTEFRNLFYQKGSVWVRVNHPSNGRVVVCRQIDWGPSDSVYQQYCRTIDLSYGGAREALGTGTGFCDSGDRVDFRFLE